MARAWPTAQVLATDLVLPKAPPSVSNLTYLKHDADSVWDFEPQSFDFMHGRMLTSGIHDWPALLSKAWAHLAPGGRLELLDVCHPFRAGATQADNPEASPFIRFGHLAQKSWEKSGLDYYATTKHVERMQQLGFVDIAEHVFKWPLGKWAETDQEKKMGELTLGNFSRFLATAGTAILTHQGFMDEDDAKRVVAEAEQDLQQNHEAKQFYLTM
jgi:SAM-dependent methyltransferase